MQAKLQKYERFKRKAHGQEQKERLKTPIVQGKREQGRQKCKGRDNNVQIVLTVCLTWIYNWEKH